MSRIDDLRRDYEILGELLAARPKGSDAAALAKERRTISLELERLESTGGETLVDEMAAKRAERRGDESPGARRQSRRGARRN